MKVLFIKDVNTLDTVLFNTAEVTTCKKLLWKFNITLNCITIYLKKKRYLFFISKKEFLKLLNNQSYK